MSEEDREISQLQNIVSILLGLFGFGLIGGLIYRNISLRKLKVATLNAKVHELELTAIRAQMNPHFLYNALNSIQNLLLKNQTDEAHSYLSRFASLIRSVLKNSSKEEISLHEELEMIKEYVHLEQLRFNFDIELTIEEKLDLYSVFIPPLLLQPLVENAILHGLTHKENDRKLSISIQTVEMNICLQIKDNGVGRNSNQSNGSDSTGKGLKFSIERLDLLSNKYGEKYSISISDLKDAGGEAIGTLVEIMLPYE